MKILKLSLIATTLLLSGCANFDSKLTASNDVNPDINGEPSPIAITVFELSDPISFEAASFVSLYTDPQSVLGTTLLAQKSIVLAPGETREVSLPINKKATYLGYIAAYRNLQSAAWQAMVPVSTKGILGQTIHLNVNASGVSVQN